MRKGAKKFMRQAKQARAKLSLLGLFLIAGCAQTVAGAVPQVTGLEALQPSCATEANALSDSEVLALYAALHAAVQLPTPEAREQAIAKNVLEPMMQSHQSLRGCDLFERRRADAILALIGRYNQIISQQH